MLAFCPVLLDRKPVGMPANRRVAVKRRLALFKPCITDLYPVTTTEISMISPV